MRHSFVELARDNRFIAHALFVIELPELSCFDSLRHEWVESDESACFLAGPDPIFARLQSERLKDTGD